MIFAAVADANVGRTAQQSCSNRKTDQDGKIHTPMADNMAKNEINEEQFILLQLVKTWCNSARQSM